MYEWWKDEFKAPNGVARTFLYRADTNDRETILSAFCQDEYKILDLDFKPSDIVLDIGAHIGAVTLLFTTIQSTLRIFSFEPMPENFDLLEQNVRKNAPLNEINIFKQAVWFYNNDDVKMYFGDRSPSGKHHKFIGSQFLVHDFYRKNLWKKVNTASLSKIFKENHIFGCRFMKLDAEGAEYGILKGAPKEVLEMIDRIHGEYHNIDPLKIKKPRQKLLEQTKGVFKDITVGEEKGNVGPFVFVKK